jgi:uncharacterized protein (UPF0216 family)
MSDTDNETPWETDLTPVDTNIATLEHRNRQHLPAHSRPESTQTLDALLRIEETLVSILEGLRHFAKAQKTSKALDELAENDADLLDATPSKVVNTTKAKRK